MEFKGMEQELQDLLEISVELYEQLASLPSNETRDTYIEDINKKLDARGNIINGLVKQNFKANATLKAHATLIELDQGIRERLQYVLGDIKKDMKDIQNAKKNEQQYANPYSDVQVMDGMYYDKKK